MPLAFRCVRRDEHIGIWNVAGACPEQGEMMTIRFGLLGAGRIGKVHAKAVTGNPAARLVAVSDAMAPAA
jgi:hypothetical protein